LNWRSALGVLVGLLLPLPLVLSLRVERLPPPSIAAPEGKRLSPVLSSEERARLATYGRRCGLSSECEPPLGCLMEARKRRQYCTDSQCTTDAQCLEGQLCRSLATSGDGPLVRVCVPVGLRQEGERCVQLPEYRGSACGPGLLCGGRDGWCARPCLPGAAASCPTGFFCADTIPEPVCLPTCEARGCPEGQHCIRFDEGTSVCAHVSGPNCQQVPCPESRRCDVLVDPPQPEKVWMTCVERCGEGFPPCPSGRVCDGWQCEPACSPDDPDSCSEGYRCKERRPGRPFACYPDRTW
jgi:hypothetical protein